MITNEQLAQVFADAADHMEAYGHAKGTARALDGSVCTVGAIQAVSLRYLHEPTIRYMRDHIGVKHVTAWNDSPRRTGDEVISTLRDCSIELLTKAMPEKKESVYES